MSGWYPRSDSWFVDPATLTDRPLFQGDVLRGVPTTFVDHPAAREAAFAGLPTPSAALAERSVTTDDVRAGTVVHGGFAMILPYPCDFADGEKGARHDVRVVARLTRVSDGALPRRQLVAGRMHHAAWVPDWNDPDDPARDWFVDLRTTTSVHAAWLNPERRVASLRVAARIALMRRLSVFYARAAPEADLLAASHAHIHPDAPALA